MLKTIVGCQPERVFDNFTRDLTHYGFDRGEEWNRVHGYFHRAWGNVVASRVDHFAARRRRG